MADALRALIRFYETGEDADRIAYDIAWVRDQESPVDTINGFVEVYLDPRGVKGAWEGMVCYVNETKTRDIQALAAHAQWFEDRMPWDPRFRKPEVAGVTARAIEVVVETGDSGPVTPVGINLPNDQAIREQYGSKSVSLANVSEAYERSTPEAMRVEFSWSGDEADRAKTMGRLRAGADDGHARSHRPWLGPDGAGRDGAAASAARRAVLVDRRSACRSRGALLSAGRQARGTGPRSRRPSRRIVATEYEYYARNALVQLRRVREGTQIEEDHMRNRQMIVNWLLAHTSAIEVRRRDGKTYYVMADADAFREGVGRLLAEVQRIKGEGDDAAARRSVRDLRRALRSGAPRRDRGARRSAAAAVLHRLRDAAARSPPG